MSTPKTELDGREASAVHSRAREEMRLRARFLPPAAHKTYALTGNWARLRASFCSEMMPMVAVRKIRIVWVLA